MSLKASFPPEPNDKNRYQRSVFPPDIRDRLHSFCSSNDLKLRKTLWNVRNIFFSYRFEMQTLDWWAMFKWREIREEKKSVADAKAKVSQHANRSSQKWIMQSLRCFAEYRMCLWREIPSENVMFFFYYFWIIRDVIHSTFSTVSTIHKKKVLRMRQTWNRFCGSLYEVMTA